MTDQFNQLRSELQRDSNILYLNTGGQGLMPLSSHAAIVESARWLECLGPGSKAGYEYASQIEQNLRHALAVLIGATNEGLSLTTSTSEGIALTARALSLDQGDEVIISDEEHPAGIRPWFRLARERGVKVVVVPLTPLATFVNRISAMITGKTRVICLSHVSYLTGTVLPIADVCSAVTDQNIITVVDGAQSVGVLPISVQDLRCDVLAFPGQKWLLGPLGTGGLFVRNAASTSMRPFRVTGHTPDGNITYASDASKTGHSRVGTLIAAPLLNSISLLSSIGLNETHLIISALVRSAATALSSVSNIIIKTPVTENRQISGLLTFKFASIPTETAQQRLLDKHNIVVRTVDLEDGPALRASFHCFQSESDVDRLVSACEEVSRG